MLGRIATGAVMATVLLFGSAVHANAAATLGETFVPSARCGPQLQYLQTVSPSDNYRVPSAGVITSWSHRSGAIPLQEIRFKVGRSAGGNNYTTIGQDATRNPVANTLNTYSVRIPVQANDVIGAYVFAEGACGDNSASYAAGYHIGEQVPFQPAGPYSVAGIGSPGFPTRLSLSAILEADADSDNFGDESQDNCPGLANPSQANHDGDSQGDACDPDDDNDGFVDGSDACPQGLLAGPDTDADGCKEPKANADTATLPEDAGSSVIDVTQNDVEGDLFVATLVDFTTNASAGAVEVVESGSSIAYTPNADYCGPDSFNYSLIFGTSAPVNVTVTCVDDPPVAVADSATATEDTPAAIDVLANDTDIDGGPKLVASKSDGSHGSVAITGSGAGVSYAPGPNYCGSDEFSYTLNGGSTASVSVSVACVDDPTPPGKASISKVTVTGPSKARRGKKASYKVRISNSGNAPATGVRLKVSGRGLSFNTSVGVIQGGTTRTVKVKVKPKKPGKFKATFKVASSNAGGKTVKKKITVNN